MSKPSDDWLRKLVSRHVRLTERVLRLLKELLEQHEIEVLSTTARTKDEARVRDKIERKRYSDPENQLTDLSGFRVVCFLEGDINGVIAIVKKAFDVDAENSSNKSESLGTDKTGYRSQHFVCSLPESRTALLEWSEFAGLKFEVQVRTALQHAWAEITHDRQYKFSGVLPCKIQRRLNLYAGLLELADEGFQQVANEIDDYKREVETKTAHGDLSIDIDSLSVRQYLEDKIKPLQIELLTQEISEQLVRELSDFDVRTLKDLDSLISAEFLSAMRQRSCKKATMVGLLRDAMIFEDAERYFEDAYKRRWHGFNEEDLSFFEAKYGKTNFDRLLERYGIHIVTVADRM